MAISFFLCWNFTNAVSSFLQTAIMTGSSTFLLLAILAGAEAFVPQPSRSAPSVAEGQVAMRGPSFRPAAAPTFIEDLPMDGEELYAEAESSVVDGFPVGMVGTATLLGFLASAMPKRNGASLSKRGSTIVACKAAGKSDLPTVAMQARGGEFPPKNEMSQAWNSFWNALKSFFEAMRSGLVLFVELMKLSK